MFGCEERRRTTKPSRKPGFQAPRRRGGAGALRVWLYVVVGYMCVYGVFLFITTHTHTHTRTTLILKQLVPPVLLGGGKLLTDGRPHGGSMGGIGAVA